jgi:hypothetical protein
MMLLSSLLCKKNKCKTNTFPFSDLAFFFMHGKIKTCTNLMSKGCREIDGKSSHFDRSLPSWVDSVCAACWKNRIRNRHSRAWKRKSWRNKYISCARSKSGTDRHMRRYFKRDISGKLTCIILRAHTSAVSRSVRGSRTYLSGLREISRRKSGRYIGRGDAVLFTAFIRFPSRCFFHCFVYFQICFIIFDVSRGICCYLYDLLYG